MNNYKQMSKGVFSGITETRNAKSALQVFVSTHEEEVADLEQDYSMQRSKFRRDHHDPELLEEYKKDLKVYKDFISNSKFVEMINMLGELENRMIKSNAILNLEIKIRRQKQKVGDTQKEWLIAQTQFKQEGLNQFERVYIGKVLDDGRYEDSKGITYEKNQISKLEHKAVGMCVSKMTEKLNAHKSLQQIKSSLDQFNFD